MPWHQNGSEPSPASGNERFRGKTLTRLACARHPLPRCGRGPRAAVKILHVIGDLAPVSGGPAKACFEMARAVARRGNRLAIYTTDFGQAPGAVPPGGAPVVRDGVELRHFPLQPPRIWLASWPLRRALFSDVAGFDLVHVHSLYLFHDWAAGAACRRAKVPYLVR